MTEISFIDVKIYSGLLNFKSGGNSKYDLNVL